MEFSAAEATARRLISLPILLLMLNGAKILSEEHISLTNQSVINHLIRKECYKKFSHDTDYLRVLHLIEHQNLEDLYICKAIINDDSQFIILCQSK
jgi:hypothetical protein